MANPIGNPADKAGGLRDPLAWLVQESAPLLNEEGEDEDAGEEDTGEEDTGEEDAGGESGSDDGGKSVPGPFGNLDLREAYCFGFSKNPSVSCWVDLAEGSATRGWKNSDVRQMDRDLKRNVDACYFFMCQALFEDLDTGFGWRVRFVNDHMLWSAELEGSPDAEVSPEDAKALFSCETMKKFAKRCGDLIDRAKRVYDRFVDGKLKEGELMAVDVPKLERLLTDANTSRFTDNLRGLKYELR